MSMLVVGYILDSIISSKLSKDFNIIGTWESKSSKEADKFRLTFYKDGSIESNFLNKSKLNGESKKGQDKYIITYTVNYKESPIHLDIVRTNVESNKSLVYPGIIKVEGRDHIVLALGLKGKRPKNILLNSTIKFVRLK